jgi:hypothetical protein
MSASTSPHHAAPHRTLPPTRAATMSHTRVPPSLPECASSSGLAAPLREATRSHPEQLRHPPFFAMRASPEAATSGHGIALMLPLQAPWWCRTALQPNQRILWPPTWSHATMLRGLTIARCHWPPSGPADTPVGFTWAPRSSSTTPSPPTTNGPSPYHRSPLHHVGPLRRAPLRWATITVDPQVASLPHCASLAAAPTHLTTSSHRNRSTPPPQRHGGSSPISGVGC